MAASGSTEVREDAEWLAELAALHCELHRNGKNPLVHLWSAENNLTRRILRVHEQSQDRIVLEVRRFGRTKPGRLEVLRTNSPRGAGAALSFRHGNCAEISFARNSGRAHRPQREPARRPEGDLPSVASGRNTSRRTTTESRKSA
jgi:hypothetical protein